MTTKQETGLVLNVVSADHAKKSLSYDEVKKMIDAQVEIVQGLEISDSMTADIALNAIKHLNNIITEVEKTRVKRKKPYIDAGKFIDDAAKALTSFATECIAVGKKALAEFKKIEDAENEKKEAAIRKETLAKEEAIRKEEQRKQDIRDQITKHELNAIAAITTSKTMEELAAANKTYILSGLPEFEEPEFATAKKESIERIKVIGRQRVAIVQELLKAQDSKSKEIALAKEKEEAAKIEQQKAALIAKQEQEKEEQATRTQEKIYMEQAETQAKSASIESTSSNINTRKGGWGVVINPSVSISQVAENFLQINEKAVKEWIKEQKDKGTLDAAIKAGKMKKVPGIDVPVLVYGGLCFFEKEESVVLR